MCLEQTVVMIELAGWKFPQSLLFPYFALREKIMLPGKQLSVSKHMAFPLSLLMDNLFFLISFTLGAVFWKFSSFNGESKSLGTNFMFLGI